MFFDFASTKTRKPETMLSVSTRRYTLAERFNEYLNIRTVVTREDRENVPDIQVFLDGANKFKMQWKKSSCFEDVTTFIKNELPAEIQPAMMRLAKSRVLLEFVIDLERSGVTDEVEIVRKLINLERGFDIPITMVKRWIARWGSHTMVQRYKEESGLKKKRKLEFSEVDSLERPTKR